MPATSTSPFRRRRQKLVFFAHMHPGLKANPQSTEFARGYATHQAGGWWCGCPHCQDTQEFADWQAGWHKRYNEIETQRDARFQATYTKSINSKTK